MHNHGRAIERTGSVTLRRVGSTDALIRDRTGPPTSRHITRRIGPSAEPTSKRGVPKTPNAIAYTVAALTLRGVRRNGSIYKDGWPIIETMRDAGPDSIVNSTVRSSESGRAEVVARIQKRNARMRSEIVSAFVWQN